jgi:kynurenine 3-monooxygenase
VVIVGDAAHAMVPFYGQGMNAGLEDVRVLFSFLDEEAKLSPSKTVAEQRSAALAKYSAQRTSDTYAINDLALENYTEMRSSVVSRVYKTRKWLEEKISVWVPSLGWQTQYSRVSFGNERYSEVVKRSERQGRLLLVGLAGLMAMPLVVGSLGAFYKLRNATKSTRGLLR